MSNYETSDNIHNRFQNQGNIGNANTQMVYPGNNGIMNQTIADSQKMPNMSPSLPPNAYYINQPQYVQPHFYMGHPQIMHMGNQMANNNPYPTMPHQQHNLVTFNQSPSGSMYTDRMNGSQSYVIYQNQQGALQAQISNHQIPPHIQAQNSSSMPPHLQQIQLQIQHGPPPQIQPTQIQVQSQRNHPQQLQHQQLHNPQMHPQMQQQQQQQMQQQKMQQQQLVTSQMQPHIHPRFQYQIMNSSYRPQTTTPVQVDKHIKTSSALEIINPDTHESIDLHSFISLKEKDAPRSENNVKYKTRELLKIEKVIPVDMAVGPYSVDNHFDCNNTIVDKPVVASESEITNESHAPPDESDITHELGTAQQSEIAHEPDITCESAIVAISSELFDHESVEKDERQVVLEHVLLDLTDSNRSNIVGTCDAQTQNDRISNNGDVDQRCIYTREELIKIGNSALSRIKPKGLPVKDQFTDPIILDYPMNINCLSNFECMQGMNQKTSKNMKKNKDENIIIEIQSINRNPQGQSNFWRQNHLKFSNMPRYIDLGVIELPLARSEDGYVTFKQRLASGEELNQTEELVRQIKGILNRIVPQNFDQCLSDLVSLKVGTHEGMTCLVNELFLKAVKEETYSVTFAKICSYLASIKADVNENEIVTFRSVLLQKCQAMFTTPLEEQLEKVREEWLSKASIEKPKTKALMESDVEEQIKKAKDRYYGNIRFIGELYLKGVLITKIICFCIENLMSKENDSDSLICLCKLLETCGAKLETESKGKEKLNNACKTLRDFTESQDIETRVRFRILDILEMRDKKWLLRKIQKDQKIEPKTLEEIKLDKEMEDEKDHYHSLNRRNQHNRNADRRQSLPIVNKNRSSITPKQLSVNSSEPTTLIPAHRNWFQGSGYKPKFDVYDNEKRSTRQKCKIGINTRDISEIAENYDISDESQINDVYVECPFSPNLPLPSCQSTANSSQNSSRSSSHSRIIPQGLSKEKLPDSKLAQVITADHKISTPDQLLKEFMNDNIFSENSWNSYADKVSVVYKWLDRNFETSCDKRRNLSSLLSMIINQGVLDKEDLLKAFAKLLDFLEDLLIDVGYSLWDNLTDYLIPFIESMDINSIEIIENIFNTDTFQTFCCDNSSIIFSLPWSMVNTILKCSDTRIDQDIFKLSKSYDTRVELIGCNRRLLHILEINLSKAISIKYQTTSSGYIDWFDMRMKEAVDIESEKYFLIINWSTLLYTITSDIRADAKLDRCLQHLSTRSSDSEVLQALVNMSSDRDIDRQHLTVPTSDVLCTLRYLIQSGIYGLDTVTRWNTESQSELLPLPLSEALTFLKSKSAFIVQSCDSFQSFSSLAVPDARCSRESPDDDDDSEPENVAASDSP